MRGRLRGRLGLGWPKREYRGRVVGRGAIGRRQWVPNPLVRRDDRCLRARRRR